MGKFPWYEWEFGVTEHWGWYCLGTGVEGAVAVVDVARGITGKGGVLGIHLGVF